MKINVPMLYERHAQKDLDSATQENSTDIGWVKIWFALSVLSFNHFLKRRLDIFTIIVCTLFLQTRLINKDEIGD